MSLTTYELLHGVPIGAEYAVDATELDKEDIPQARVDAVMDILRKSDDREEHFLAARLLCSWGYHEGLAALEKGMAEPEGLEGFITHRLHGCDDTYNHVQLAVLRYFADLADRGEVEEARRQVYAPLSRVIALAANRRFEISAILEFIRREGFLEYMPSIEQYFLEIIKQPEIFHWKIAEAANFFASLRRSGG
ncbi:hypothetical protein [Pseudomonas vanderleydeniana]|uniref:Uncharacterized protein n=1 Tax=Pseudomonas vanderleydeniana TaxID=2745495 RepID=A0A9E6TUL6_9PSED|nr:hypothetical protein [Pseudomonas vanderleydeniana]QXI30701.1 hypothetical protein HU752_012465 [Pseudomonas vanderleydeniana]